MPWERGHSADVGKTRYLNFTSARARHLRRSYPHAHTREHLGSPYVPGNETSNNVRFFEPNQAL
jgi:hypothetical protein